MAQPDEDGTRDARRFAPAAARNREPILDVLRTVLPRSGLVVEIASGTGEHAVHFAAGLPDLIWQPSDPDPDNRASIGAWRESAGLSSGLANIREPLALDACSWPWPVTQADALVCINMIHIAPWEAAAGLMHGAGRVLSSGAPLVLYGPFMRDGRHTAPSNAAFDETLRARDERWGVRDLAAVAELAGRDGLVLANTFEMPANNLTLVFRR